MKANVGDIAHVKCVVTRLGDELTVVDICGTELWVNNNDIVHVERAPLKVGDAVRHALISNDAPHHTYKIVAIDGEQAWVKAEASGIPIYGCIRMLSELRRADEPCPLKVGDRVRHIRGGDIGTVIALGGVNQPATVKWDYWERYTPQQLADLERLE